MFTQVADFLCGPFFYPVFFASLLHAFDFFVISAAPDPPQPQPRVHPSPVLSQHALYPSEKKTTKEKK